jgi:hypothetical protein
MLAIGVAVSDPMRVVQRTYLGVLLRVQIPNADLVERVNRLVRCKDHIVDASVLGDLGHLALKPSFEVHLRLKCLIFV